jgi:hypothetical protein
MQRRLIIFRTAEIGDKGMSTKVLDRLAEVLDLHLVVESKNESAGK